MKWYWVAFLSLVLTGCNPGGVRMASDFSDERLCYSAAPDGQWSSAFPRLVEEAQRRGLDCGVKQKQVALIKQLYSSLSDAEICRQATHTREGRRQFSKEAHGSVAEAKLRGLACGVESTGMQAVIIPQKPIMPNSMDSDTADATKQGANTNPPKKSSGILESIASRVNSSVVTAMYA